MRNKISKTYQRQPPAFAVGDTIEKLKVTAYLGTKPLSYKKAQSSHYYDLICECGEKVANLPQGRLVGNRRRTCCNTCAAKNRIAGRKKSNGTDWRANGQGWNMFDLWRPQSMDGGWR